MLPDKGEVVSCMERSGRAGRKEGREEKKRDKIRERKVGIEEGKRGK